MTIQLVLVRLYREIVTALHNPRRLLKLADKEKRSALFRALKEPPIRKVTADWQSSSDPRFQVRSYETYEQYIQHQKGKLDRLLKNQDTWFLEYDIQYQIALKDRLTKKCFLQPGMNVLCLAARIGTEVRSFLDLGCFAVGLDLNPGPANKYVVVGDFHDIQFPTGCADVVFTNSLDHALDIDRVIAEIKRVLKPGGFLIIEAIRGSNESASPGSHESFFWSDIDALIDRFENSSFKPVYRESFAFPWKGEHVRLQQELCQTFSGPPEVEAERGAR